MKNQFIVVTCILYQGNIFYQNVKYLRSWNKLKLDEAEN